MSEVDIPRQTGSGKVCLHFAMSVDGYVAGPEHSMDFLSGATSRPSLIQEYIDSMGAVLAGRDGFDSAIGDSRPYGGAWQGPIFVLTHHPDAARPAPHLERVRTDPTRCASLRYHPSRS